MPRYQVGIKGEVTTAVYVEAEDEDVAHDMVQEALGDGTITAVVRDSSSWEDGDVEWDVEDMKVDEDFVIVEVDE